MPDQHRDRLLRAATHFNWPAVCALLSGPTGLATLIARVEAAVVADRETHDGEVEGPRRVKVSIDSSGEVSIETNPTPALASPSHHLFPTTLPPPSTSLSSSWSPKPVWTILLDETASTPAETTHYKTSIRDVYDSARKRAGILSPAEPIEVLLSDAAGRIMEGSMTTPYFWRGGRWVTPATRGRTQDQEDGGEWEGGQDGTTRRWALERGLAVVAEEDVLRGDVGEGEEVWISNGVRGFMRGVVRLRR